MTDSTSICQNCSGRIPDSAQYCPMCGQSILDIKQPWLPLLMKMMADVFDWDGRMVTTLKHLMLRPGTLTVEFVQGHRKKFTPPVRLYLIVSLLFFLIFPIIMPAISGDSAAAGHDPATEQYSRMMFILLPVFALLLKLFYRQQFYMQHLVFSMHVFAAMFIVFTLMLSLENLADQSVLWVSIQSIVFGYMIWYCLKALKVVYKNNWWLSSLKFLGLVTLFLPALSGALNLASLF